jgi:hypothetical protein
VLYRVKDGKTLVFIIKFSVDYTDNQIVLSGRTILYGLRLSGLGKTMKSQVNTHISIAEQIIEGSISIKSIDEFKSVLKIFPSDAALQKAYSDLLLKEKRPNEAAGSYDKSARLFIDSGKILQASFFTPLCTGAPTMKRL